MQPIRPTHFRYIKLGAGGSFARASLERGELQLGYQGVPHELCAAANWDGILAHFQATRRSIGKARDSMREVKDFYTLGSDCLWITFADGLLWWAFADTEVTIESAIWRSCFAECVRALLARGRKAETG